MHYYYSLYASNSILYCLSEAINLPTSIMLSLVLLHSIHGVAVTIHYDQVLPFAQSEPVTISEKAVINCVSFPVVNAAGEISGGLKRTKKADGCTESPMGSQVYGRASWYRDRWAIVYAWYFPKNFRSDGPKGRHCWASMVLWLENPALENQKLLGASLSQQTLKPRSFLFGLMEEQKTEPYEKLNGILPMAFVGMQRITVAKTGLWSYTYYTSMRDGPTYPRELHTGRAIAAGIWEQWIEDARADLNSADFCDSTSPFTDQNFELTPEKA
ncbi:hypothetical protein P3T76_008878 [Phytophthora citrophthora]|uniref:Necrosis inducing-like protein NPP1 type n=1 Tax=Phytophthora citrophthora TaxID=4793 RepID=A0AAD9GI46_9STRA|nr:hypothetical protein P3T76_008878 [Phytophthora citrophthora]